MPYSHLNGAGCPNCKESFGEKHIAQILNKYNIKYIKEYRIQNYRYFYDFYLPDYDIYIEYHGRQHYEPLSFFGGIARYEYTQKNDKDKIELVSKSGGLLIVIKYTFNTLEQIEDELIRLFSYIHPEFLNNKNEVKKYINNSKIYLIDENVCYTRI